MRKGPTLSVASCLILAIATTISIRKLCQRPSYGFALHAHLTSARSLAEIEDMMKEHLERYYAPESVIDSYKLHRVEDANGTLRWVILQVAHAPRGIDMFDLYCYKLQAPNQWTLRAYVPVNVYDFTNGSSRELEVRRERGYVSAVFRKTVVFTADFEGN